MFELFDATAQPLDIEHPLHRGQGGVEGGDIGLTVGIHGSSGYLQPDQHQFFVTGGSGHGRTFSIRLVTSPL
jgi:hypothetical protein